MLGDQRVLNGSIVALSISSIDRDHLVKSVKSHPSTPSINPSSASRFVVTLRTSSSSSRASNNFRQLHSTYESLTRQLVWAIQRCSQLATGQPLERSWSCRDSRSA